MKTRISRRFILLVATAAVAPLVFYGVASIHTLRASMHESAALGNMRVAFRAAEEIALYTSLNIKVLQSLAAHLDQTHLDARQQDRILKNYVLDFPEFREITLFDEEGRPLISSRLGIPGVQVPDGPAASAALHIAPVTLDDDLLPKTTISVRLIELGQPAGWLVGELSLEQLWRMVDEIRVGERGYAMLVAEQGLLIAHGDPDEKRRVARGESLIDHPLVRRLQATPDPLPMAEEQRSLSGNLVLAAAALVTPPGWIVLVEQPTEEAYSLAHWLERQLLVTITLALLLTVTAGYFWSRSFIRPIAALTQGTRALAEGRLEERVRVKGRDELAQLGNAFNSMADRLVELQEDVRKQERQAMFGRIAAGLVHDVSHPIQNIGNSCRLILKMYEDAEYRQMFRRTVERELGNIKRVLEDLRNVARPIPLERFPVDINRSVGEIVESMRPQAEAAGVSLQSALSHETIWVEGDLFALGRVYRNLILNGIQATPAGGLVKVATEHVGTRVRLSFSDTGCGIPQDRLRAIFDDFVTTKHRGLGLGLAISRKIVEQLDGTISVSSVVGQGTTFMVEFEAAPAGAMASAAS